jgi:membrane protease YdiL (CAAX protease family)
MTHLWKRLPVVVQAVISGLLLATAGTVPWALLVSANTKYWSSVPWAVPPTALYLWFFWRFVRGNTPPRSTSETRRALCRAQPPDDDAWGMALFAGFLGLVAVVLLQGVLGRLVTLPQQQDIDPSKYPVATVLLWVLTSAAVSGIVEESAFRGYMQGPIERRHGPVVAIFVTGSLFGFAHFTHPEVGLMLLPYYLAVAAVYGALAYLTNSIFPSLVLHAGGNVLGAADLFVRGRSEWQASAVPQPLIWETGTDAEFWLSVVAFLVAGSATVWAMVTLAGVARRVPEQVP